MKTWRTVEALSRKLNMESDSTDPQDKMKMLIPLPVVQWMAERFMLTDESGEYYMKPEGEARYVYKLHQKLMNRHHVNMY